MYKNLGKIWCRNKLKSFSWDIIPLLFFFFFFLKSKIWNNIHLFDVFARGFESMKILIFFYYEYIYRKYIYIYIK